MKKNMIALAVAAAVAAPAAMADTTIYGKLNVNINSTDGKDASVNSTASRIGFKGSKDLDNGLKAVYKMEYGINIADGDNKADSVAETVTESETGLSARNQYLGLAGGFGTVLMGRHDTPFKMSQPSDLFNDGAADLGKMSGSFGGEVRATDVLAYISPKMNGFQVVAANVSGELEADTDNGNSVAVMYGSTKDGIYAAFAYNFSGMFDNAEQMRLSAQYKANGLIANVMHQTKDVAGSDDHTNTQINVGYKMGKFMPKFKYSMVENGSYKNSDGDTVAIADESGMSYGLNYSLGNKTTAYIYATDVEDFGGKNATIAGVVTKF